MIEKKEEIIAKIIGMVIAYILFFSVLMWLSMPWYLAFPLVFFVVGPLFVKCAYK